MMDRRKFLAGALLSTCVLPVSRAAAQSSPANKTIRLIVPFPPGGASDTVGRVIGLALGEALNTNVVVENRAGAGGMIGAEALSRSPADGSVIGLSNISPHGIAPLVSSNPPYDPVKNFTHIALVAETASVMIVSTSKPWRSIADFVAAARQDGTAQKGLTYGSSGVGSPQHLQGELLSQLANVSLVHVPYRGNAPALQDLLAGQVDMVLSPLGGITGAIEGGQVRVIGITSAERMRTLPDAPTFAEQGFAGITMTSWSGISAPAGLPVPILQAYNKANNEALAKPEVTGRLERAGLFPPAQPLSPEAYAKVVASFPEVWAPVIKAARIPPS